MDPDDRPVRDLFVLWSAALAIVVSIAWGLSLLAEHLAPYILFCGSKDCRVLGPFAT